MVSQRIGVFVDMNDYLEMKRKGVNMSEVGRNLFKSFVNMEIEETDVIKLEREKQKIKDDIETKKLELAQVETKIVILDDKRQKEDKIKDDMALKMAKTLKASGILED